MRKKSAVIGMAILGAFTLFSFSNAQGATKYMEAPVSNGATLIGQINFKGTPPPHKIFELAKFPQAKFCSQVDSDGQGNRILKQVTVKDGKLQDVVVLIKGITEGKPMDFKGTDVLADKCRFLVQNGPSTFVGVVVNKDQIRVLNNDADPSDPKSRMPMK